jgi:hypothetical protein
MTVKDLIKKLEKYPLDFNVVIQQDKEYLPLQYLREGTYYPKNNSSGYLSHPDDSDGFSNVVVLD